MTIVKFRRGRRQPAAPSNAKATCSYKAILTWPQGLEHAPVIYPVASRDEECERIRQRVIAALNGGPSQC